MILVCGVDYFRKKSENVENEHFFFKKIKKSQKIVYKQKFRGLVFLSGLEGFEITCTSIRKKLRS